MPGIGPALSRRLEEKLAGDLRCDALSRTIYSTDASLYEIVPVGVVLPKTVADVVAAVHECGKAGVPITARGAGTGLTGGAVGNGLQIDLSRYMHRIGTLDLDNRTVEVEPGVVLDDLNTHLRPHGLQFGADVATSSRATLGGMIANNSCGAHSIIHGRTVDHLAELTVVLADGAVVTFGKDGASEGADGDKSSAPVTSLEKELAHIRDEHYPEIERRFPKILRSNGGYGLDRLGPPGTRADAIKILCGSEGTLGIVVGAKLKLIPVPKCAGLVLLHFNEVHAALRATPAILQHKPAAVELVDRMVLDAGRVNATLAKRCDFLQGDPAAVLIVEFYDNDTDEMTKRIETLQADGEITQTSFAATTVLETSRQADVWNLRKSGLGLLMSKPGDAQPQAFVEDSAVDPARLSDYIERFTAILKQEDIEAGYYAHASAGCIHMRPVLNLKQSSDVERMRRIAEAVCDLAIEFGGTITGEHGDGRVRSCWLEKLYGPKLIAAFKEIKNVFDPENLLNPNKIVDPLPMTEHLRYGTWLATVPVKTYLDFSEYGGMVGLAGMCSGVGACRQRLIGAMCPSYMATRDEQHTTRARANALRVALSDRGLLSGLDDPHLADVMDLCISCKACKTECPTGVDMARMKSEYLNRRNQTHGVPPLARLVADMPRLAPLASRFPRISNAIAQSKLARAWVERHYGFDRRIPPPRFADRTLRAWFRRHRRKRRQGSAPRGRAIYFVDTWTNYYAPQVGIAAVTLLERAGFEVDCPQTQCCGRPAISKGLLAEARQLAETNVYALVRNARAGVPIIGTEPSCILTFVDEYPQLVRTRAARLVASRSVTIESFLLQLLDEHPDALTFTQPVKPLLYHAHCQQKAVVGPEDAVALLQQVWGEGACLIDSGCCGMAGSFGHEKAHYEVSQAIGEERLFPTIRNRGDADVAISGFSCRHQIGHHTDAQPKHVIEYLADALASP
ncbi:MAG: FAD-binding protein [Phycisphaerales bacterium]|nr:MAG: FAD-binding protein [Phycisphaerales bacterium]